MSKKNITTVSSDELDSLDDRTRMNAPDGPSLGPDFWKSAKVSYPDSPKKRLTVRFDRDVVAWFKAQDKGYQTRMNAVLRSFYETQQKQE